MYTDMQWWEEIRQRVRDQGVSKREILRETGMHWTTLEKALEHPEPPGYRMKRPRLKPKLGPYLGRIRQIIEEDKALPKKQRHTAKRILERIREEGYSGGYAQLKEAVREIRRHSQEVLVPLLHGPGEGQFDVGEVLVKRKGVLGKAFFFVMSLPYSGAVFVQVFERSCTETFWEAHRRAFAYLGGVPRQITYDNDRTLVANIIRGRERKELSMRALSSGRPRRLIDSLIPAACARATYSVAACCTPWAE